MTTTTRTRTLTAVLATLRTPDDPRLAPACEDIDRALIGFRAACHRMQDARASALGAASYDGPNVTSSGGSSSSTERLALTHDPTAADRAALMVRLPSKPDVPCRGMP